mgnify:CR=1 FL=1
MTWVKAHLTQEQAKLRGIDPSHWDLNRQADLRATEGLQKHTEDPGAWVLREWGIRGVAEWQQHLVKIYLQVRKAGLQGPSPAGITPRLRPSGPRRAPRKTRTDEQWHKQHAIAKHKAGDACLRCGKTTVATRQGRLQQWRRRCVILKGHARRLHNRHRILWNGRWECSHCPLVGAKLSIHGCLGRHPTGKKRYTAKQRPHGIKESGRAPIHADGGLSPPNCGSELGPIREGSFSGHSGGAVSYSRPPGHGTLMRWAASGSRGERSVGTSSPSAQSQAQAKKPRYRTEGLQLGIRDFFNGQSLEGRAVLKRPRDVCGEMPPAHLVAGSAKRPKL